MKKRKVSRLNPFNWDWKDLAIIFITSVVTLFLIAYFTRSLQITQFSSCGFFLAVIIRLSTRPLEGDIREIETRYTDKQITFKHKVFPITVPTAYMEQIYYRGEWWDIPGTERHV